MTLKQCQSLARLPKWVGEEIAVLERSVKYWQTAAHAAADVDAGQTNVIIDSPLEGRDYGLPPNSHVVFRLQQNEPRYARPNEVIVSIAHDDPTCLIINGRGPVCAIKVLPRAANMIYVTAEDH